MANWYNTDWWHRVPVILSKDKAGGATLTDFTACLGSTMPAHFWSKVRADGKDCVLTMADGVTPLFREVPTFDVAGERPEIHFLLPSYSHLENTLCYLYYGNPDAALADSVDTWPSHWKFVSHMANYGANQIKDSTVNANHGTKGGAYASNAANLSNGTGTLDVSPTSIAAGTGGTEVTVTSAGTFTITVPANQKLNVVKGTVTTVSINDNGLAGARTITVTGTGTFTATWATTAAPTEVAGLVGRAQEFVEGNGQYIKLASPVDVATAIILANVADYTANRGFIAMVWNGLANYLRQATNDSLVFEDNGNVYAAFGASDLIALAGTNVLVTVVGNGTTWRFYRNTTLHGTALTWYDVLKVQVIGVGNFAYMNGTYSELRLSSSALSGEWIEATDHWLRNNALCYEVGAYENRPLYVMQGYRRVTTEAKAEPQTYRRVSERTEYVAQGYRRLTLPAEYIAQGYRRVVNKALYTIATKRRLRPLYRILGRPSYGMDHHPKPDYGL